MIEAGGEPDGPVRPRTMEAFLFRVGTAVKRVTSPNTRTREVRTIVKNQNSSGRQNMRALEQANKIRLARAEIKRRIAKGDVEVAEILLEPADEIAGMEISELLTSQKRWGTTRCTKFMDSVGLSESKTIRSLTERQRSAVAAVLSAGRPAPDLAAAVVYRAAA